MVKAGDIIVVDFPGVQGIKRRPAIVVSSDEYHRTRPDVIVGLLTSQLSSATGPTDCLLQDWRAANLHAQSAFRSFFVTLPRASVAANVGKASSRDWQAITHCVRNAIAHGSRHSRKIGHKIDADYFPGSVKTDWLFMIA